MNKLSIDACRNKSGGAINYLIGILENIPKNAFDQFDLIEVWTTSDLKSKLPINNKIIYRSNFFLNSNNVILSVFWQTFILPIVLLFNQTTLLFSTDASTLCLFKNHVVLSQDMLSYEPGIMKQYGFGLKRIRLEIILKMQNFAFRNAKGVIFLTRYASEVIKNKCGSIKSYTIIPHGIDFSFKSFNFRDKINNNNKILCLYISNVALYKNHWNVVKAIEILRGKGYNLELLLVGAEGNAQNRLINQMKDSDPDNLFVNYVGFVRHDLLIEWYKQADIFVFASSCENMPITLLEAMAMSFPIACSNKGPMPEVLKNGGQYFDPINPYSISESIERLILDSKLRNESSLNSKLLSEEYSWARCSNETFDYLVRNIKFYV